jgi:phosphatidate cytidylyltransferase
MGINPQLLQIICAVFVLLAAGSVVRLAALRNAAPDVRQSRLGSLRTWWILAVLMAAMVLLGQYGIALLLITAGSMGLREYLRLIGFTHIGRPATVLAFVIIPVHYALILSGHSSLARQLTPVLILLVLSAARVLTGVTEGYIRTTAAVVWGTLMFAFLISHALLVTTISADRIPPVGAVGWFLYLVILTETNDISQALVGRRLGRRRITPTVSPNKSWEGLAGGITVTTLSAVILAPWLTTFHTESLTTAGFALSAAAGLLISAAGFLGDINMSAIKRDVGVKNGSSLLPGQGGIIDRIDSLTFTAPAFYYFVSVVAS